MSKLGPMHWMAVTRIMQYLKDVYNVKLRISSKHINLKGYLMWMGSAMWKTVGLPPLMFFSVEDGAVSWNSKWQQTIIQSTMEAKYMTTSRCIREAIWLRQLGYKLCARGSNNDHV